DLHWGHLRAGQKIGTVAPVFPRLDAKAIDQMVDLEAKETARLNALFKPDAAHGGSAPAAKAEPPAPVTKADAAALAPETGKISIDDFAKVDLRVGQVVSAERVKGADKLLQLRVDIGEGEPRTLMAGIAEAYPPEQLIGRKVVIVAKLPPPKQRGVEANGLIVSPSVDSGRPRR